MRKKMYDDISHCNLKIGEDLIEDKLNDKTLLELFVEQSDVWELFINPAGEILFSNNACEKITGYNCKKFLNGNELFSQIIVENEKRKTVQVTHEYRVKSLSIEYRVQSVTGEFVWVKHNSRAVYNQSGEYIGRKISISRIDEFKERELKLIEAQNRLKLTHSIFYELVSEQSIENVIRSALYQTNIMFPDLRITYASIDESGLMNVQYSQNIDNRVDAEGKSFDLSLLKMERSKLYKIARPFKSEDVTSDVILAPYKTIFNELELRAVLVMPLQYSKMINGVICFDSRDTREWTSHEIKTLNNIADFLALSLKLTVIMSKQKRAERKYREVSTRMTNLMDNLIGGIIFEDVDAKIVHVNKSFCSLFNLGDCYKKLPNLDSGLLHEKLSEKFVNSKGFLDFTSDVGARRKAVLQREFRLNDNRVFEIDYIPVFLGTEYNGRLWHFHDITERVKVQEELEKSALLLKRKTEDLSRLNQKLSISEQELQKANDEKDKFFSILAHDLRHPFSPILGFSELLIEEAETLTTKEVHEFASIIFSSSKNLHKLVENLLQWSRVQSGRIAIDPEPFRLSEVVETSFNTYGTNAENKGVKLFCNIPDELIVYSDQNSIDTILRNLISNAIKFTGSKGSVTVASELIGDSVKVTVQDTGIGIKKENLNKLFRLDAQFTTPGTEKEKGTGLGLILVKEFLELNNSRLEVSSEPDKGTTFSFILPLAKK